MAKTETERWRHRDRERERERERLRSLLLGEMETTKEKLTRRPQFGYTLDQTPIVM